MKLGFSGGFFFFFARVGEATTYSNKGVIDGLILVCPTVTSHGRKHTSEESQVRTLIAFVVNRWRVGEQMAEYVNIR